MLDDSPEASAKVDDDGLPPPPIDKPYIDFEMRPSRVTGFGWWAVMKFNDRTLADALLPFDLPNIDVNSARYAFEVTPVLTGLLDRLDDLLAREGIETKPKLVLVTP